MASTSWVTSPSLRTLVEAAADAWHDYRVPLLLSLFTALLVLRVYLHFADPSEEKDGLLVFPKLYGANETADTKQRGEKSAGETNPTVTSAERSIVGAKQNRIVTAGAAGKVEAAAAAAVPGVVAKVGTKSSAAKPGPRRIKGEPHRQNRAATTAEAAALPSKIQTLVFFTSLTGATAKTVGDYVKTLHDALQALELPDGRRTVFLPPKTLDLAEVDLDEYFIAPPTRQDREEDSVGHDGDDTPVDYFYLFFVPSYNIDTINDTCLEHFKETHHDFRIDTAPLMPLLGYSVFGFGDREGWPTEAGGFCFQALEFDKWMAKLTGRKRAFPLGCGDVKSDATERLAEWSTGVVDVLGLLARTGSLGEGVPGSGDPVESDVDDDDDDEEVSDGDDAQYEDDEVLFGGDAARTTNMKRLKKAGVIDDVEDLGRLLQDSKESTGDSKAGSNNGVVSAPIAIDFTSYDAVGGGNSNGRPRRAGRKEAATSASSPPQTTVKEMVAKDTPTYKSLTKQGYAIVGSHSGVKICRWTKSALRGRGSCYKFSFYGIHSHQCMETTPSLSCSNKCVFCWRHGTNPVGTTWRWVVDPPDLIFNGVKANHYAKIKNLRGVPGVRAERFAEALRIRHCALSLVGEPIFYPHINEFLGMLHGERISSFLVCNAQHPDQLAALHHVTQLYVSIDATNRESLRKIDRPLHRDFWERFQRCLAILRENRFRQRTVFRLTLVKGFNLEDEVRGYADLVEQALPCFVEIKGVTYCGTSTSAGVGLTMANVPFYHEVCEFVVALEQELQRRGLGYGLAAEHAHSCCVLIASERFKVDGRWHTLIDYDKFFALLQAKGPTGDFAPEDYMGPATPEWANWGNGGFDPRDQRVDRKGRPIAAK
ncbi:flavodoxin and radical sam domain containing protein [Niveomyces insectorum RCEF 264]|uniref:tRNA 4-demethylwyosine synthase (AdoMet-dependent) n=1 Tax=Niveomyces insectorum RCEF 264 TaxID=1081102 RepID=A0A168A8H5_9HYPO|nr:flavodoxin and radical sam domain containing protein [Niveomyces insectorum RCEF 264]